MLFTFILAYIVGAVPTSIITCRILKGVDIRQHGSGNAGATNVYRIMGFKVALFVLCMDALKGVFGVFCPGLFLENVSIWYEIAGGLCAITGHIWSVFARFKGGKGVGTALGVFLALSPVPTLAALLVWIIIVAITRIVSVASIAAGITLACCTYILYAIGRFNVQLPLVFFTVFIACLVIVTHRANIKRIMNGTEKRIGRINAQPDKQNG